MSLRVAEAIAVRMATEGANLAINYRNDIEKLAETWGFVFCLVVERFREQLFPDNFIFISSGHNISG